MNESEYNELEKLRIENARLRALLAKHGIVVEESTSSAVSTLSLEEKVMLFRSLFQGREDVFARRWFSPTTGKSGYQPVCAREWNRENCDKKKYKCAPAYIERSRSGSVNLMGRSLADTNVIRMNSSDFANALMDALRL